MIKKTIAAIFCIATTSLLLYSYFAGVCLVVENDSIQKIDNVQINYGRGSFSAGSLENHQVRKKSLGKIGEGANFQVMWHDKSGLNQKTFNVYFHGSSGYLTVRIKILANGEAVLFEGDRQVNANK